MKRDYEIPVSRWSLIWPPIIILSQLTIIIGGFTEFAKDPGFKTGWQPMLWVILTIGYFVFGFYQLTKSTLISIEGNSIHVQSGSGKGQTSPITVTSVTEDQLNFFLDSGTIETSISKKRTPSELAEILNEKIQLQTADEA